MASISKQSEQPSHLETLVPGDWGVWRWFALRGAGFPAHLIKDISQPECGSAADAFLAAETRVNGELAEAIVRVDALLDRLKAEGHQIRDEEFRRVLKARNRLADKKLPQNTDLPSEVQSSLKRIDPAILQKHQSQSAYEVVFAKCILQQSAALQKVAGDPLFQEAGVWQNRRAFETSVLPLLLQTTSSARNQRQRHREETVAKYAQRYCLKNDTIGFFGPAVWGQIDSAEQSFQAVPGASLFENRRTYFETWAIDRLAMSLSLMDRMQWWIPPRLAPDICIENGVLHRPGLSLEITEQESAVLQLCDGTKLPDEIFAQLIASPQFAPITKNELRDLLIAKESQGIIVWRFLVPVEVNSEVALRQQLERIGDMQLRRIALDRLDRMEAARQAISNSTGRPEALNEAMTKAEQEFVAITQSSGSRNPGATYGARTIVYEDCRRDFHLQLTPELIKPITPALCLLFQSLRWLVRSIAKELDGFFRQTFDELVEGKAERELPLLEWWLHTEPRLLEASSIPKLEQLFAQKWAEVLKIEPRKGIVRLKSSDLISTVEEIFPEIDSAYCPVRYFCPDLMLAAENVEAINRGELIYILGEVHSAKNTLGHVALVEQHPDPEQLVKATEWDWGTPRFKILDTQQEETTTVRTSNALICASDCLVATTADSIAPRGHVSRPISDFIIRKENSELHVLSRDDGRKFHILDAFSDLFSSFVMNKGSWIPPLRYTPRIFIDDLVIRRATWRFSGDDLAFAGEKDESRRFLEARRWMNKESLPRRMFVRSPREMKPFYLDLDSPVSVDILARAVRAATSGPQDRGEFTFSEMLPDHNQLWVRDAKGMRYTSELRFAFVDLKARAAAVASHVAMS